ncbi:class I adenylate-forming enzyme family protein [Actinoplanes couchii]|uniref:AMP-dependent ligase n=1 Tax=Actinoplanes couchii TaxID=403638 RepID=A0ABQ3XSD6_9ACTN|nr:class I adenylate-forming enzyme family protein [Actinoplanes couchii]MDR6315936.1 long-chain acyl-CoA synthetase [Actinoplanes couchii]GID61414.1 AMP-dependent ligase [Actinoplanes couchii]
MTSDPTTLADVVKLFLARGDSPALSEPATGDDTMTYAELGTAVLRAAAILRDRHQVQPGQRVATIGHNGIDLVVADLAVMALGAVVVPMDPRDTPEALGWSARRFGAALLLGDARSADLVAAVADAERIPAASLLSLRTGGPVADAPMRRLAPHDAAVILSSSGSTARPKGIVLTHANLVANAASLKAVHRIGPGDRHLCVLPMFHANAFGFSVTAVLGHGAHLVIMDGFQPIEFATVVLQYRVHVVSLVPELLRILASRPKLLRAGGSLRYVVSAAAPLPQTVARQFTARTGLEIHQGYGLSECTNFATAIGADISAETYAEVVLDANPPSIGTAIPGCSVEIRSDDGTFAADEQEGEIVVRGDNVMTGYWKDPEATGAALTDGWLRTGDEGFARTVAGQRFFFVTGRRKDLIIRLGEKVSPSAVERELAERGVAGRLAVVGFGNTATGEEVGLYFEDSEPAHRDLVEAAVRELPFERQPKVILYGDRPIPRTSTGKVRRRELRRAFDDWGEARFTPVVCPVIADHRKPPVVPAGRGA